jgi:light-regulated signal transduction histidine kinase (bacteriophytochrome)
LSPGQMKAGISSTINRKIRQMLTFKPKTESLEKALAARRADLDQVKAAHKAEVARRDDLANQIAHAVLDQAANVADVEVKLNASESKLRAYSLAMDRGHNAVLEAERAATAERERDIRAATATRPRKAADALERSLAPLRLALAQIVEALDHGSFPEITAASMAPAPLPGRCIT